MSTLVVVAAAIGILELRRRWRRQHRPRLLEFEDDAREIRVDGLLFSSRASARRYADLARQNAETLAADVERFATERDDLARRIAELRRSIETEKTARAELRCAVDAAHDDALAQRQRLRILTMIAMIAAAVAHATIASAAPPTAEDLYAEGQAAYDRADYATAVARWQAAYDLSGEPELLFDVAQARRLSGDCTGALAAYRRFVETDPTSAQHALAISLGREMAGQCGQPAQVPEIPPDQTRGIDQIPALAVDDRRDAEAPGHALKIAGLVTGGAGALAIVVGIGIGHHGHAIGDDVTRACSTGCDWAAWKGKDEEGRRDVNLGLGADVLGVAAIVVGAGLYVVGARAGSVTVAPTAREDGATISWSGSW